MKREEGGGEGEEEEDRDRKSGPLNYNQVEVVDTEKKKTKEEQKIRQTTPKKKQDEVEEFNKILAAATAEWEQVISIRNSWTNFKFSLEDHEQVWNSFVFGQHCCEEELSKIL